MINIVAVDDHPLILAGLEAQISKQSDMRLVATANHGSKLLDLVRQYQPDIAIVDLGMSTIGFNPMASVRVIKQDFPGTKVLVYTSYDDGVWVRALVQAGVSGYMLKSDCLGIVQAIHTLDQGDMFCSSKIISLLLKKEAPQIKLTDNERHILVYLEKGESNEAIAKRLDVSEKRIRNLMTMIFKKFGIERGSGLSPRIAAVNRAHALGLLPGRAWDANMVECYHNGRP